LLQFVQIQTVNKNQLLLNELADTSDKKRLMQEEGVIRSSNFGDLSQLTPESSQDLMQLLAKMGLKTVSNIVALTHLAN